MNRYMRVDISHKTVFFITGFLALLWALYLIKEVIILLFIAIILMSALSPIVETLQSRIRVPKTLAIAMVYVVIIAIIAALVTMVVQPLIDQTTNLAKTLPQTLDRLSPNGAIDKNLIQQQLSEFSKNAFTLTLTVFSDFITLVSILVLTFYMLLERDKLDKLIAQFFINNEERVKRVVDKIEDKLGAWMRGQLALSFLIGTMSFLVLFALNIPYALPLAILAGLMEVVPVIGPIISAIPAILVAYVVSPVLALMVAGSYLVIQQLESHLVVPQVMKKAVGLNPLIVILAVAIGGRILGIAGALLAVPIAVVIQIITEDVLREEGI